MIRIESTYHCFLDSMSSIINIANLSPFAIPCFEFQTIYICTAILDSGSLGQKSTIAGLESAHLSHRVKCQIFLAAMSMIPFLLGTRSFSSSAPLRASKVTLDYAISVLA